MRIVYIENLCDSEIVGRGEWILWDHLASSFLGLQQVWVCRDLIMPRVSRPDGQEKETRLSVSETRECPLTECWISFVFTKVQAGGRSAWSSASCRWLMNGLFCAACKNIDWEVGWYLRIPAEMGLLCKQNRQYCLPYAYRMDRRNPLQSSSNSNFHAT